MDERPATDDAERLLASLDDLGARIETARSAPPAAERRTGAAWALGAIVVVVLGIVAGILGIAADDGDDDTAAGVGDTVTTALAPASSVTATTAAPATTEAPSTTAAPVTTAVPTTTAAPVTTAEPAVPATAPPPPVPVAPGPSESDGPGSAQPEVTVEQGDSFWTIAEDEAASRLGREPTLAEVTELWADVLAANADRLVEPGNPNLIFAGQVVVLPGAGAAP